MNSQELKIGGIYEHYKGMRYKLHCIVKHSETLEDLVMYETLYENPRGKMWVRPLNMFFEDIEINGVQTPRFKLIEP